MRTYPSLEVKTFDQLNPGDLVIALSKDTRCLAIFSKFRQSGGGEVLPVLIKLPGSGEKPSAPFFSHVNYGSFLCLGSEYAVVIDPLRHPSPSAPPSKAQLIVSKANRFLCAWDLGGRFQIAVNLDTGEGRPVPEDYDAVECPAWEIRLKVGGSIDWTQAPLYRFGDPA